MYNFDYVCKDMIYETTVAAEQNYLVEKKLRILEIENGYILPFFNGGGGLLTKEKEYIDSSFVHCGVGKSYEFDEEMIDVVDKTVVYIGMFNLIWGHCITDNLKHLWVMLHSEYSYLKDLDFVYLVAYDNKIFSDNFIELLSRLGIEKEKMFTVQNVTKFKKIILPEQCFSYNYQENKTEYTKEYIQLVDKISEGIFPLKYEKIYFTRSLFNSSKDFSNEKKIENILMKKGYKIFSPEKLSLAEEIALLKGCSEFVTSDGSLSHNAIFLNDNSTLVILRKSNYMNRYQAAINKLKNINVVYIDSNKSVMCNKIRPWEGPFFVYPNKAFCSYFGIEHVSFPYLQFIKYIVLSTSRNVLSLLRKIKKVITR